MGLPYSKVEEMGFMLPLIELKCNYKNASKYEDNIVVRTKLKEITPVRVVFYYEVFRKEEPVPVATGETTHVWTDKALKPVNIKKHSDEIYQLLKKSI
jgi:acyl-CoA thioester hydrolase